MKLFLKHLFAIAATIFLSLCCVCCEKQPEKYGEIPDEQATRTPITSILDSPETYIDKAVVIEGTIASECPTGGWIGIEDTTGHKIYVELHGTAFAPIPQRIGKKVVVKGIVFQSEGASREVKLLGQGVLIQ